MFTCFKIQKGHRGIEGEGSQAVSCPPTLSFSCALPEISLANTSISCIYFHKCWCGVHTRVRSPVSLYLSLFVGGRHIGVCRAASSPCTSSPVPAHSCRLGGCAVCWQWVAAAASAPSSQCPVPVFSTTPLLCSKLVQFKTDWLGGRLVPESALGFGTLPLFCTNCSDSFST